METIEGLESEKESWKNLTRQGLINRLIIYWWKVQELKGKLKQRGKRANGKD